MVVMVMFGIFDPLFRARRKTIKAELVEALRQKEIAAALRQEEERKAVEEASRVSS